MRHHLFAAAWLALCATVHAQEAADAQERARIGAERTRAEAEFAAAEKACYARFAVNDCIGKARSRLRATLSDLRRQEVSLNDAERRRRAADRLREIEARQAEQPVPSKSQAQTRQPEPPSAPREPAAASSAPARAAVEAAPREAKSPADPQANARRQQQRIDEARAHKEKVQKRAAERTEPPRPLPVPP
jgi:colicin import membrane protein